MSAQASSTGTPHAQKGTSYSSSTLSHSACGGKIIRMSRSGQLNLWVLGSTLQAASLGFSPPAQIWLRTLSSRIDVRSGAS